MDELMVKSLRGEATDIELRRLDHWRAESGDHEREYREFVSLWNMASEPTTPTLGPPPGLRELIREGDVRRAREHGRVIQWAVLRSPWTGIGLSAAAAAIAILLILPTGSERSAPTHGLFPVESSSSPSDVTTLGLSDGSIVRMMPETRVEFPATVDRREVTLEGRAFFAVTAGPIPFVVRTHLGEVTVHGTRFEVSTMAGELRVVVVEGTVRLESESGSASIGPDQVAYLRPGSSPQVFDPGDVWSMLEWADGLLIFEATPLSKVAAELSRHFGRKVSLSDGAMGNVRITAWFGDESLEEVVFSVCMVAGVPCEVGEDEVRIGR